MARRNKWRAAESARSPISDPPLRPRPLDPADEYLAAFLPELPLDMKKEVFQFLFFFQTVVELVQPLPFVPLPSISSFQIYFHLNRDNLCKEGHLLFSSNLGSSCEPTERAMERREERKRRRGREEIKGEKRASLSLSPFPRSSPTPTRSPS